MTTLSGGQVMRKTRNTHVGGIPAASGALAVAGRENCVTGLLRVTS